MSNLNIHDRSPGSPKAGSKRRASSPPREREDRSSISSAPGQSEAYHRRSLHQLPNRGSSSSRFHPNHSSISSASSVGIRHGSLGSSLGLSSVPSSATSYASGRLSPGALSPAEMEARFGANKILNPTSPMVHHQRTPSESTQGGSVQQPSIDSAAHSRNGSLSHMQGIYICECCPKKPKKFDTEDELRYVSQTPVPCPKTAISQLCCAITNRMAELMSQRSSMRATIAQIGSRIRTRQKGTRIHSTSDATLGRALRSQESRQRSTRHPTALMYVATVGRTSQTLLNGMFALNI